MNPVALPPSNLQEIALAHDHLKDEKKNLETLNTQLKDQFDVHELLLAEHEWQLQRHRSTCAIHET